MSISLNNLKNKIQLRKYQSNIVNSILKNGNTLVVLPTGTGKTIIAFYLLLEKGEGFFLAPTRPLIKQHHHNFIKFFPELKKDVVVLTGEINKKDRIKLYSKKYIFATPQTIIKDAETSPFIFQKKLFIFDECHRTVGKYAYSEIAKKLDENKLLVGLTASPGGKDEKIKEVMELLKINNVEIRIGKEEDIQEYIYEKEYNWVFVSLTPDLRKAISNIKTLLNKYKEWFKSHNLKIPRTKSELISFRTKLNQIPKPFYYQVSTNYSILFNLSYFLEIIETQGFNYFLKYFRKIEQKNTKAAKILTSNSLIKEVVDIARKNVENNNHHPKFYKLTEILDKQRNKKLIVFLQYIETINELYDFLVKKNYEVYKFMGRRKDFNKRKQEETIEKFRKSKNAILLSSSVGEEGIDIPSVDSVVFFDVVPSEIRSIQRRGRAGRLGKGSVFFIITLNTMEVAFYRASVRREKIMKSKLKKYKSTHSKDKNKIASSSQTKQEKEPIIKESLRSINKKQKKISEYF